jgi:hypothetical protein
MHAEKRITYRVLVGKTEVMRVVGRSKHRWEDNIQMDLRGTKWGDADWLDLAHGGGH